MKRYLIGSLVGAILVFGWQAVAHMFMHHHDAGYRTVPNQESAIATLSGIFKEEGQYFIPMVGTDATAEELEKFNTAMEGKPWAQVIYHTRWENDMGKASIRSFSAAFLSVLIFIWLLGKEPGTFGTLILKSLGVGFLMFTFVWYNQNIWMKIPWDVIRGELIDLLVAWGLCGLWLGFWLNKTGRTARRL